jgi:hypothetical protein
MGVLRWKPGETSDLSTRTNGYVLARLTRYRPVGFRHSTRPGLTSSERSSPRRSSTKLMTKAKEFASAAASSTLESAASSHGLTVTSSDVFTRGGFVAGLGRLNEAIGAAFSLPVGAVSSPVKTATRSR